jgi:hypothetical protein
MAQSIGGPANSILIRGMQRGNAGGGTPRGRFRDFRRVSKDIGRRPWARKMPFAAGFSAATGDSTDKIH